MLFSNLIFCSQLVGTEPSLVHVVINVKYTSYTYTGGFGGTVVNIYQIGSNFTINGVAPGNGFKYLSTSVSTYDASSFDASANLIAFPLMDISTTRTATAGHLHYVAVYNAVSISITHANSTVLIANIFSYSLVTSCGTSSTTLRPEAQQLHSCCS